MRSRYEDENKSGRNTGWGRSLVCEPAQAERYTFRRNRCGVECRHDHDGNGCHSCGVGSMRRVAA